MIITVRYASQTKVEISPLEGVHFGVSAIHSLSAEHIQSYFLTCSAHTYHRIYVTFHIVISLYRFIQSTNKNVIFRLFNSLKKGFNASIKLKKMSNIEEELENVQEDVGEQNIQRNRNPKKKIKCKIIQTRHGWFSFWNIINIFWKRSIRENQMQCRGLRILNFTLGKILFWKTFRIKTPNTTQWTVLVYAVWGKVMWTRYVWAVTLCYRTCDNKWLSIFGARFIRNQRIVKETNKDDWNTFQNKKKNKFRRLNMITLCY